MKFNFKCLSFLGLGLILVFGCAQDEKNEGISPDYNLMIKARSFSKLDTTYLSLKDQGLEYGLRKAEGSDSIVNYILTIKNTSDQGWKGIVKIDLEVQQESREPRFFLPGFIYGNNRADQPMHKKIKTWPRLKRGSVDLPFSNFFLTRADRLSHPLASIFTGDKMVGIGGSPYLTGTETSFGQWNPKDTTAFYRFNGFGVEILPNKSIVSYTIGYENSPWMYKCCKENIEQTIQENQVITIPPNFEREFQFTVYNFKASDERKLNAAIKHSYSQFHESPRRGASQIEAVEELTSAIYQYAFDDTYLNYATSVSEQNGQIIKDVHYSIAWTGGMTVAYPMLMASIRLDNEKFHQQALAVIQNIVDNAYNAETGLPYDAHFKDQWGHVGWWQRYVWKQESKVGYSSYLIGQAIYYILAAYEAELRFNNVVHQEWLEFAIKILERVDKTVDKNGEYPYMFSSLNGDGAEYDSFGGAWCLAAKVKLNSIRPTNQGKIEIDKSLKHYWEGYIKKMECYGTPHDIWKGTDQEGILAFIKATRLMHEKYGDRKYQEYLTDAVDYEFTWKYAYNAPIFIPPLSKGWSSSGASITSIANPHAHAMGNIIADEILYLSEILQDDYYRSRLNDVLLWPLQSYNRVAGQFDFGKKGWMSERFCVSEGLVIEKYQGGEPSSTWFVFHPWSSSAAIESHIGDNWNNVVD